MLALLLVTAAASPERWDRLFEQFKADFEKTYDEEEHELRRQIFHTNQAFIEKHNAEGHSYTLGVTPFADLTTEEFRRDYFGFDAGLRGNVSGTWLGMHEAGAAPDSIDWRTKGAVTPVKNQGQCGSCWAFSSTGALEGAFFLATGKLVSVSEQQFVDCAKFRYGNMGCSGGRQMAAFSYAEKNAMDTEDSYAYTAKSGTFQSCKASSGTPAIPQGDVTGYKEVGHSEDALLSALAQQPVSISIEADQAVFQHYKSGVLTGSGCGSTLDHAVLAVGYGEEAGQKYWIVKNSWGAKWGQEGYINIVRGTDECGILNGPPVYPVLKASQAQYV
jgi:C1A family cysteine protease